MQFLVIAMVAVLLAAKPDPTPGLIQSKEKSRRYTCERVTPDSARQSHPGQLVPARPRGEFVERSAVICTERLMRPGLRQARDELILSTLHDRVSEHAAAARSLRPDLQDRTWLVESFYPHTDVSSKIVFATKNALMTQGMAVSDRQVSVAAGDVDVLTRMSPYQAYPAACTRYADSGSLSDTDALLAIVSLDPRESVLHAGLCDRGQWSWLR